MYQNIYFQREKNLIHLWDDTLGYRSFPYTRYAYEKSEHGMFTSIYGDSLTKIYKFSKDDPDLFESDVAETTRVLVDLYTDSDEVSTGHTILTYDIEVEMLSGLPDTETAQNEITSIAMHDSATDDYFVLVVDKDRIIDNKKTEKATILRFDSERELLQEFLTIYETINPTIVTGWNIDSFDTPYLYNRLKNLFGQSHANRLSPIGECFWSPYRQRYYAAGVSYLDYIRLYRNYNYTELPNYRLDTIGRIELDKGKVEYDGNLDELFKTDLEKFIEYNLVDVEIVVELDRKLQFIELCQAICHAGHVPYEDFVYSSKYLEGALLTYLKRRDLVAPNKPQDRKKRLEELKEKGEEKFIGAYVKPPIVGKYEWIYDLDLTSLYPSIIMTLNISPESKIEKLSDWNSQEFLKGGREQYHTEGGGIIKRENLKSLLDERNVSISSNGVIYSLDNVGCIPGILDLWFKKRVEYKDEMKRWGKSGDTEKYEFYKKRQLVQKILLNSLYGVLGLPAFRFYDRENAEAVTTTGQEVIKSTADMVNVKYNKELGTKGDDHNIYIDTDSIFFSAVPILDKRKPGWEDKTQNEIAGYVNEIAEEVQDYLNQFYDIFSERILNVPKDKHRLEIKKEYVAKAGLWIAKKRYAQWIISDNGVPVDKLDVKGLDIKRSSFPKSFQKIMSNVLIDILKGKDELEITDMVMDFKNNLSKLSVVDIAKNSSVKNLSKYMGKRRKPFEIQKGTPAHVKAAIIYNDLLQHYKSPYKYSPMRDGDKIKWVYLKNNPMNIDGVALNGYNDPPEIEEFIQSYIDYDRIFERELKNKLQDFYDAVGWGDIISEQRNAEKFFSF